MCGTQRFFGSVIFLIFFLSSAFRNRPNVLQPCIRVTSNEIGSIHSQTIRNWCKNGSSTLQVLGIRFQLEATYGICIGNESDFHHGMLLECWNQEPVVSCQLNVIILDLFVTMDKGTGEILVPPLSTVFLVNGALDRRKWASSRLMYYNNSTATFCLLLKCGDIEMNPGPDAIKRSSQSRKQSAPRCTKCEKVVAKNHKRCICTKCFDVTHAKCSASIDPKYVSSSTPKQWVCPKCILSLLPFQMHDLSLSDDEWEKQLKIMHINTQSMVSTFDGLLMTLKQFPFDVVSMSETWLKNNELLLQHVAVPGYCYAFRNRDRIRGGGVGVYVRDTIKFVRRRDIEERHSELEHIWIELPGRNKNTKILLGTIYRSESQMRYSEWIQAFEDLMNDIVASWDGILLLAGDVNVDMLRPHKPDVKRYTGVLNSLNLKQVVTKATRTTRSSRTLIDHVITNQCYMCHPY